MTTYGLQRTGAVIGVWLGIAVAAMAATYDWQHNAVSTDWANVNNWRVGAAIPATPPGSSDLANFAGASPINNQPTLDGARSVLGLIFNDAYNADWVISGAGKALTIGANGIAKIGQRGTTVIAPDIVINGSQTWYAQNAEGLIRTHIVQFNGAITGTGDLNMEWRGGGAFLFQVAGGARTPAGVAILGTVRAAGSGLTLHYNLGTQNASDTFVFGGTPASPTALTLDGATLQVTADTTVANVPVDLANPLQVETAGGTLTATESGSFPLIRFTGAIRLGGPLNLTRSRSAPADCYTGTITLHQAAAATALVSTENDGYNTKAYTLPGNIVDGSGPFSNPLILRNNQNTFTLSGTGNTYSKGTVVDQTGCEQVTYTADTRGALVVVAAGSSLGTGGVMVLPAGIIRVTDSTAVAPSASVRILSSSCNTGVFGAGYNGKPAITADSSGVLALDANSTGSIDLGTLGNGRMFLGSTAGGTYSGATLGVGADNTYRLGGGIHSQTLTVNSTNVITGTASLQVGNAKWHGTGTVRLNRAHDYTGATDVSGHLTYDRTLGISTWGSQLHGVAQTAGSPFGGSAGAVTLRNGYLRLIGATGGLPVAKGQLSFEGRSYVSAEDNGNPTYITFAATNRVNRGTLVVRGVDAHLGGAERIFFANPNEPGVVNGVVAPYIVTDAGNHFASYAAGTGFGIFSGYVALPGSGGAGTEVVQTAGGAVADTRTIYAIKTTAAITGAGKLVITGGGIIMSASIAPAVDFGSAEGVIWYDVVGQSITGVVSGSNGITVSSLVSGRDGVILSNTGNNFTGPITVSGGTLSAAFDTAGVKGSLGDLNNDILLDGGTLRATAGNRLEVGRTITLGASGGVVGYQNNAIAIYGQISGPGTLVVGNGTAITLASAAVNDYQGGTRVINMGNTGAGTLIVSASTSVGTGDVQLESATAATFLGDANVASGASVHAATYATANFQSAAPAVGGLFGSGNVKLGTTAAATTLTVGTGHVSSWFHGSISQLSASFPGRLTKTGNGTFTLYGNHTFTGPTTVSQGTLMLMGTVASNLVVSAGATLGVQGGRVAGSLTIDDGGILAVRLRSNSDYDTLTVGQQAALNGTLQVTLEGGYVPASNTEWTIIGAGDAAGAFDNVQAGFAVTRVGGNVILSNPARGTMIIVR